MSDQASQPRTGAWHAPQPAGRAAVRGRHRGAAVVLMGPAGQEEADGGKVAPVQGWGQMLGNASVADLLEWMLGEADVCWPERTGLVRGVNEILDIGALAREMPDTPHLIVMDGRQFPLLEVEQVRAAHRRGRCDATLIDVRENTKRFYEEAVRMDGLGRVRQVDRIYGRTSPEDWAGAAWPAMMVLSREAWVRLAEHPLPDRLSRWPGIMLRMGLRLRGAAVQGRSLVLHDRKSLDDLMQHGLLVKPEWLRRGGMTERSPRVWVGRDVEISPSAQLIGPLAIGDGAKIGPEALVVGPAAIGRGAQIAAGAMFKRGVIAPGAVYSGMENGVGVGGRVPIRLGGILRPQPRRNVRQVRGAAYRFCKRAVDIVGAMMLLAMTLPFYAIIATAIKLSSPGPVFYAHIRQGRGGRSFKCWKFRTMVQDADRIKAELAARNEVDGPQFKMRDDPRIFRFGRFLRRYNIDEWPQFVNVLTGQMSLVGPRPSPEGENRMCPAWREARLSVRPGITGLWQVYRRREGETDFQEWIYYDVQYVKKQSLWLDLKVLLLTVRVALRGT